MENVFELARKFTDGGRMAVVWRDFKPDTRHRDTVNCISYEGISCLSILHLLFTPFLASRLHFRRHSGALLTTSKLRVERLYGLKLVVHPSSLAAVRPTCPISKIMNGGMSVLQSRMAFISRRRAAATREI